MSTYVFFHGEKLIPVKSGIIHVCNEMHQYVLYNTFVLGILRIKCTIEQNYCSTFTN